MWPAQILDEVSVIAFTQILLCIAPADLDDPKWTMYILGIDCCWIKRRELRDCVNLEDGYVEDLGMCRDWVFLEEV